MCKQYMNSSNSKERTRYTTTSQTSTQFSTMKKKQHVNKMSSNESEKKTMPRNSAAHRYTHNATQAIIARYINIYHCIVTGFPLDFVIIGREYRTIANIGMELELVASHLAVLSHTYRIFRKQPNISNKCLYSQN